MNTPLDPRLVFRSFAVTPQNRVAVEAARSFARSPDTPYDPLVIRGGAPDEQLHLLHAIGQAARGAEVVLHSLAGWARTGVPLPVPEGAGAVLLLHQAEALGGRPGAQAALLSAVERAAVARVRVAITAARPLEQLDGLDTHLLRHFFAGLSVDLGPCPGDAPTPLLHRNGGFPENGPGAEQADEFGSFLADITSTVAEVVAAAVPPPTATRQPLRAEADRWFLDPEKFAWGWIGLEDRIVEELG